LQSRLNAAVKRLRSARVDDADNPRFVETLPRRGDRFIAALAAAENQESLSRPRPA
jgi:DNA-binding winged helix-turn-helix (wHTH) protein